MLCEPIRRLEIVRLAEPPEVRVALPITDDPSRNCTLPPAMPALLLTRRRQLERRAEAGVSGARAQGRRSCRLDDGLCDRRRGACRVVRVSRIYSGQAMGSDRQRRKRDGDLAGSIDHARANRVQPVKKADGAGRDRAISTYPSRSGVIETPTVDGLADVESATTVVACTTTSVNAGVVPRLFAVAPHTPR